MYKKLLIGIIAGIALIGGGIYVADRGDAQYGANIPTSFAYGDETVNLAWTDDNSGETLIIKSDKQKYYSGDGESKIFFSITNTTDTAQNINIKFITPDNLWDVKDIKRIDGNEDVATTTEMREGEEHIIPAHKRPISVAKTPKALTNKHGKQRKASTGVERKEVGDILGAGETRYFEAVMDYKNTDKAKIKRNLWDKEPRLIGEFFIEAFGSEGAYGHLDPSTLLTNILAYYQMDSGELTTDETGNGKTLTNNNTVGGTASGLIGYGADTGNPNSNKYFSIANTYGTTFGGAKSFSLWFKFANNFSADSAQYLFSWEWNGDSSTGGRQNAYIYYSGTTYKIYCMDSWRWNGVTISNPGTSSWHNITITDSGTTATLYYDGDSLGTRSHYPNTEGSSRVAWGADLQGGVINFAGYMDEIGVWSRELSSSEVGILYNSGVGCQYPFTNDCLPPAIPIKSSNFFILE